MTARAGLIPVAAALFALAGGGLRFESAHAESACLDAPDASAPVGSHWFYRTDQATQRKCWYVRPTDQPAQAIPAQQGGNQGMAATAANPGAVQSTNDKLARRAQSALGAADGSGAGHGAPKTDLSTWHDPAPAANAPSFAWPAPPPVSEEAQPDTISTPAAAAPGAAGEGSAATAPTAAPASPPPAPREDFAPHDQEPAAAATTAEKPLTSHGETTAGMIWAGLLGLLIAGLSMRSIIARTLKGKRKLKAQRREPVLIDGTAANGPPLLARSPSLVPGGVDADHRVVEVEAALRTLARQSRRPRAAPINPVLPFVARVTRDSGEISDTSAPTTPPKMPA